MAPSTTNMNVSLLIGRLLVAALFLPFGLNAIMNFQSTVNYITSNHIPFPQIDAAIAIVFEVGFAALLLVGYKTRWAALALILFVLVVSFLFHHFWDIPAAQVLAQKTNFFKNMAIAGGLFAFVAAGAGDWSVDAKLGEGLTSPMGGIGSRTQVS